MDVGQGIPFPQHELPFWERIDLRESGHLLPKSGVGDGDNIREKCSGVHRTASRARILPLYRPWEKWCNIVR